MSLLTMNSTGVQEYKPKKRILNGKN